MDLPGSATKIFSEKIFVALPGKSIYNFKRELLPMNLLFAMTFGRLQRLFGGAKINGFLDEKLGFNGF